ncbi:hypothetical protein AB2L57_09260 [Microbacterium sp. HA-8]|uniref:hypothetical protein n=1 Tax=Microbacterium sp. HA-8 TaxID=3234200 RepID=UPI0038F76166
MTVTTWSRGFYSGRVVLSGHLDLEVAVIRVTRGVVRRVNQTPGACRSTSATCVRFFERTCVVPRLNASDGAEFALARWLGRQLHRLRIGSLEQNRAEAINWLLRMRQRGT